MVQVGQAVWFDVVGAVELPKIVSKAILGSKGSSFIG